MTRIFLLSFVLSLVLVSVGCDQGGLYPYGRKTDVIRSCGADSSVYLRSTDTGTDVLILGHADASRIVTPNARRCLLDATVDRNSTTSLAYGDYDRDAAGDGEFHALATYDFRYTGMLGTGAERLDYDEGDYVDPIRIAVAGDQLTYENMYEGTTRTYTNLATVLGRIDVSTEAGRIDLYQVYNVGLFLGQVRVPAFGGIGMTRYATATGRFGGLVSGRFTVSVDSLSKPWARFTYSDLEDFPFLRVDGRQVTKVDFSGTGPMEALLSFEIRDPADRDVVRFAGSVDYGNIGVANGVAASGTYTMNVTTPQMTQQVLSYTYASNVDLRNIVPVAP